VTLGEERYDIDVNASAALRTGETGSSPAIGEESLQAAVGVNERLRWPLNHHKPGETQSVSQSFHPVDHPAFPGCSPDVSSTRRSVDAMPDGRSDCRMLILIRILGIFARAG